MRGSNRSLTNSITFTGNYIHMKSTVLNLFPPFRSSSVDLLSLRERSIIYIVSETHSKTLTTAFSAISKDGFKNAI